MSRREEYTRPNGAKVVDRRESPGRPWGYVVMQDTFMSGWGEAEQGTSWYALAVSSAAEAEIVEENARLRPEMRNVRITLKIARDGGPVVVLHPGDHLSIADRSTARAWYEPGAFKEER